ncbi:hypothetical protein GA0070216_12847 [Micromonospora matsumotoense]|uniref:Uncharacterized protein n=1 Tax=Micromonospora matsumotoense TaxID=121616 RepID=A0A1C5AU54_9ACTN|nr:hypothetical protein [Micromonospora matsumotoense]SCF48768.1 hypothetical protein GA0070216_12847 [Micromonospora matsumotoense]
MEDGSQIRSEKRLTGLWARTFDMAQIGVRRVFDPIKPQRTTRSADEVESFREPPRTPWVNPAELARVLGAGYGGRPSTVSCLPACDITMPPLVFFDTIRSLYRETYLDRAARAALLRLVAVQPGVSFLGEATDRAGRKAIGVTVADGGTRFSLLFERNTGVLLASEYGVPGFVLNDYSLYLTVDRRGGLAPANGVSV